MTNQKQEHVNLSLRGHGFDRQGDNARAVRARALRLFTKHINGGLYVIRDHRKNMSAHLNNVNWRAL